MKLSVIIPYRNSADTIGEQLDALANQGWFGEWEVILADNGSTDRSNEVIERFRDRLPELRIIDASALRGAGYARNIGAKVATGEALLFCDSDDKVGDGWIEAMAEALSFYDFVAGAFEGKRLNRPSQLTFRKVPQTEGLQKYDYPDFLPHAGGGNLGVKRLVHEAVGGFDESMLRLMDTDYCWRIQLAGTQLHFVPEAILHMRVRGSITSSIIQAWLWGRYNVLMYKKYRPFGMPKLNWKRGLGTWIKLVRDLPKFRRRREFSRWLFRMAWYFGRLEGCVRYRVLAL